MSPDLARYHELTAPGRGLSLFESTELEELEQTFGQKSLPLNTSHKQMPKKPKANGAAPAAPAPETPALLAEPLPEGVDIILPANKIVRSPWNREHFTEAGLAEMEASIRTHGILTRPLVRPIPPGLWWIEPGTRNSEHGWFVIPKQLADDLRTKGSSALVSDFYLTEAEANAALPTHELVFGERRWRGASRIRTDYPMPVTVRPLSDRQALELQKLENLQREDVDPIEEARGLKQMVVEFGYSVDQLAKQLGKSKSDIYGRIKLASLCGVAADLYRMGAFEESVARRIARLPSESLQVDFLQCVNLVDDEGGIDWDDEQETVRDGEAGRVIAKQFMRELKGAPFNPKDANLVAIETNADGERVAGGACTDCPFKLGNQPDYDPKTSGRADMCLNTVCFRHKAEVAFAAKSEKHSADGGQVLTIDDPSLEKIFNKYGGISYGSGYEDGAEKCWDIELPGKKEESTAKGGDDDDDDDESDRPTYLEVAKHLNIQPTIALNPYTGDEYQLIDQKQLSAAAKAGLTAPSTSADWQERAKKEQQRRKRESEILSHVTGELLHELAKVKNTEAAMRFTVVSLCNDASADQCRAIVNRRGIDLKPYKGKSTNGIPHRSALLDFAKTANPIEVLHELAITPRFPGYNGAGDAKSAAKALGLDYGKLESAAKAEIAEKKAAKKPKAKAKAPPPPPKPAAPTPAMKAAFKKAKAKGKSARAARTKGSSK